MGDEKKPLLAALNGSRLHYFEPSKYAKSQEKNHSFSWTNINAYVPGVSRSGYFKKRTIQHPKHILKNVNGMAVSGECLAIMGASGAGKTTMLNALTFRNQGNLNISGIIALDNKLLTPHTLTNVSAYVQQEDLFVGTLTVKETLIFQSKVRMSGDLSRYERMCRVNQVLFELSLQKCADTLVGIPGRIKGISGGEKKRLAFACEILTDPMVMFCDEPTSGLDSFMAQQVVAVMQQMARSGKIIISTIHQPSSPIYAMFDKVMFMAEGRAAFLGTADEANQFFQQLGFHVPMNYNPSDFYIRTLAILPSEEAKCMMRIKKICDAFEKSATGQKLKAIGNDVISAPFPVNISKGKYKVGWFTQFFALSWRSLRSTIREPALVKVRLIQTVFVGLLLGAIYWDAHAWMDMNGAIFLFLTNMTFQNVFAVINVFCGELPIFFKEHFDGMYRVDTYFLSKTLVELPLFMLYPFLFTAVCYYLIGLDPSFYKFLITCGITILVAQAATSFGYMISCLSRDTSMALSIAPPLIVPFMLFGGFFLNNASVPFFFEWLKWLSWFLYGNEALVINQWRDSTDISCNTNQTLCPQDGNTIIRILSFDELHFNTDIIALVALIVGYRFLGFLALLWKTYRKS